MHFLAKLGEDPRHLAEQVLAVRAGECVKVLTVPAGERRPRSLAARPGSGGTSAVKSGSKKNGNDSRSRPLRLRTRCGVERYQPPVSRSSMSPMLQTNAPGIGGASIQPSAEPHLQAAVVVLGEQGEQAVVGVLADSPVVAVRRRRRVVEDPEQHRRVGRVPVGEVVGVEVRG